MKKFISNIIFGRDAMLSGLIALAVVGSIALGCNCTKDFNLGTDNTSTNSTPSTKSDDGSTVPPESQVESLVKASTAEFAKAVDSGDFSTMHSKASNDFQVTVPQEKMKETFKSYTDKRRMVVPILNRVASTAAVFSSPPSIRTERSLNILVASGRFPTKPLAVKFDYEYVWRGGEWKLLKFVINM